MKANKMIPPRVTQAVFRRGLVLQKNSPHILFAVGVAGVVGTAVFAARATLKLEPVLENAQKQLNMINQAIEASRESGDTVLYTEREHKRNQTIIYTRLVGSMAKLYAPAIGCGVVSVAALTGSHVILSRRTVALTAAYTALERGFNDYRSRVISEFGEDKDRELKHGVVTKDVIVETDHGHDVVQTKRVDPSTRSQYARFFDQTCKAWEPTPEYNLAFLRAQQQYANDMLHMRGHVFLNDVYDSLGINRTKAGAVVGWVISKDGDNYIDFGIFDRDNPMAREFVNGNEHSILLDFNVDGVIYDKI